MTYVLDACAIIAYLRHEEGAEVVWSILNGEDRCLVHAINLCEVYYDALRVGGVEAAENVTDDLFAAGVDVREDMDRAFWAQAGRYKSVFGIALADCFALALVTRVGGALVSSDHREFDRVSEEGACAVRFIR
jgi:predicted nucleic acid-binding protein